MRYLSRKYVLYALSLFILSYLLYFLEFKKSSTLDKQQTKNFINGIVWNQANCKTLMEKLQTAINLTIPLLKQNKYPEVLNILPPAFKNFEKYRRRFGFKQLETKITLDEWFAKQQLFLETTLLELLPIIITQLSNGELSPILFKNFEEEMPAVFMHKFQQKLKKTMPDIKKQRLKNCANWVIVRVTSLPNNSSDYETIVREILQKKWKQNSNYKLIFGGTMSFPEKRKAFKSFDITIAEKVIKYGFGGANQQRGTAAIPESTIVQFKDDTQTVKPFSTSWDKIKEISVFQKGPEALSFRFEHKRQTADFSALIKKQRSILAEKLKIELEKEIPFFEIS